MNNEQRFNGEWETKRLADIGEISGAGVDKKVNPNEVPVRLVNYLDVYNKTFLYSKDLTHEVTTKPEKVRHCVVEKGDVFFTPSSEVPDDIGTSAVAMENISDGVYSYHVVRLRLKENWDICFRGYIFQTKAFLDEASRQCEGSGTRYVISLPKFRSMAIRFPPSLEEQRAIAKVLSDVDGLINALDALIAKKRAIKQATMQQLLTGKTRLPGFNGDWETKQFEELFRRLNGNFHKIQASEYSVSGLHPVIDQGQDAIVGYSDQTEKLFKCPADGVIVFGDHTRIFKFVDVDFLIGADGTQLLVMKRDDMTKFFYYQLLTKDIPNTGYNRHFKFLKELTFKTPKSDEQHAIAAVLSDMDAEITALEQRRDKTIAIKQGMMQLLLTGKVRLLKSDVATKIT